MAPARTFPLPLLLLLLSPRPGAPGGCSDPEPPWRESLASRGGDAPGTLLHLRVRPFSSRPPPPRGLLFPGGPLFSFVRRVYRCCQERRGCGSVRGIPGRPAGSHVEFLLTRDVLALALTRAELHLRLSNPHNLDLRPVLPAAAKRGLPTRYSSRPDGDGVELRVDLLFLIRRLQGATDPRAGRLSGGVWRLMQADGDGEGEGGGLDLGLGLDCHQKRSKVGCEARGVQLSQTPFMVIYY